jgi:hypothetical protein
MNFQGPANMNMHGKLAMIHLHFRWLSSHYSDKQIKGEEAAAAASKAS